ncbi:MAG: ABC transporter substrate-binding protein, partial [Candidatus Baltobacteraceae bacterium]
MKNSRAHRRLGPIALGLVCALLLSACSSVNSTSGGLHPWTIPGTFRWADAEDVDNLNPLLSTETLVNDLSSFTMGYFFVFNDKGDPVPSLCLEVPTQQNHLISADGKTITFKLRHGVKWQDGAPFSSADVVFTVKTILDPRTNVL